ncbi:MAG: rubrerythrin family protein [Deltaproteobacteria bacterium]|nr:rubrerythrin family protein [Deltaproteobacteria bacterium]
MRKMTEDNIKAAFAGESQAHTKYQIFAYYAEKEGKKDLARLFNAVAYAELVHAKNHFKTLGGIGGNVENLSSAVAGETFEITEMYPAYDAVAKLQEEKGALRAIKWAIEAEKAHKELFEKAKATEEKGEAYALAEIHICAECGYTVEGEVPDKCPLCGKPKEIFKSF